MSSGLARHKTGAVESTNAAGLVVEVGFRPKLVRLYVSDGASGFWADTMPDASALKRIIAGDGSLVTTGGITPGDTGFTLDDDANLNPAGEVIRWEAIQ